MSHTVRITARALNEIDSAVEWIAERSPAAAYRWLDKMMEAIDSLEENPERCGLAPESESR